MSPSNVPASMDDIVFAGRNKQYGAYDLRKWYSNTLTKSLVIGGAISIFALLTPAIARLIEGTTALDEKFVMKEVELLPPPPIDPNEPPPPPPPELPPPPKVNTVKFLPPEIKPDNEVQNEEPPPTQDDLKDATPSDNTQKGDPNADENIEPPSDGKGDIVNEPAKEEIFTAVEIMPSFPGGMEALGKFLNKNMKYPKAAQRANVSGKVYLTFVVNGHGKISEVKVLKGVGFGCDEEAVRVVESMPSWNPGKQGGRSVSVKYTLPISFQLQQ